MSKRYEISLTVRVAFLFISLSLAAFCLANAKYNLLIMLGSLLIYQVVNFIQFINKTNTELAQFIEAVQYRDFSLQFAEKNAPVSVRQLRKAFNQINNTFKQLSSEKEEQFQYLQKVLELVDTGILSYNAEGEIGWMNESLKKMLNVPYLRNLSSLEKRDESLYDAIVSLKTGSNNLVKIAGKQVLLAKTAFMVNNERAELIAFQNVNEAIEDTEAQAYQKLLRVMTHEIMNSVAPIASLAGTIQNRLNKENFPKSEYFDDIELGILTIKNRSENLLKFADTYRTLSKVAVSSFSTIYVRDLFENVELLLESNLEQKGVELEVVMKDWEMTLEADNALIEQVLINLLINAVDAVKEASEPKIRLSAYVSDEARPVIEVRDNGTGMSVEMMDKIFVPFFTSKKNGSGIGLSLSKQIMALHKGAILVESVEGKGTVFKLIF
ncbi:Histidine kinase-, DNA gyrase B-, and HSP90-like ATPase [Pseudarcicella hirudinis]|uniref:histidine kinase n=1 Tax=Pseudarcicella hirudinis TaxID=1079859 RepID=A0A1I5QTW9_9BACT|nr:HAMP domain-containing sensor histidine kinase [Pseudarcicella hirudinis]SFP49471.1 Histidine kinase-, DNA gyrase B-, and HSP90-like ATPase [Pseudarcicella hirudinis]